MPVKIPVRGDYDSSGTPTGLSEFQSGEYVSTPFGGTGQSTYSVVKYWLETHLDL